MSAVRVLVVGRCNDCGEPHGRLASNAAFCFACVTARRTSPARKIYKAQWSDANRDKCRAYSRRYVSTHPPRSRAKPPRPCATLLCKSLVLRDHGRKFCDDCREFYGYANHTRWYHRKRAA